MVSISAQEERRDDWRRDDALQCEQGGAEIDDGASGAADAAGEWWWCASIRDMRRRRWGTGARARTEPGGV
jgi:hypothetical protein